MIEASKFDSILLKKIRENNIVVGIVGMGYVGLPLSLAFCEVGCRVLAFDLDGGKIDTLNAGRSFIKHIADRRVALAREAGLLCATVDMDRLSEPDAILICVPTPLTALHEPDLSFVIQVADAVARNLRAGQIVVLESTTYPGTTEDVIRPLLAASGLRVGSEIFLAYSPEREDPGNVEFTATQIPKIVGADDAASLEIALALYNIFAPSTVAVSSSATAEAVKITENVFRAVNIALANELKSIFTPMGINVWEVIEAAKTKPFGYMPFYPGPGAGGHCIPIDPHYLIWRARDYGQVASLTELSGDINSAMPGRVVHILSDVVAKRFGKSLKNLHVLLLGVAYKRNSEDCRESPALKIMEILENSGAVVSFHDPHVEKLEVSFGPLSSTMRTGVAWDLATFAAYDVVLISTDHDGLDYRGLAGVAKVIVDTRNACANAGADMTNVVRA